MLTKPLCPQTHAAALKKLKHVYPVLQALPELPPSVCVVTGLGMCESSTTLRIPAPLLGEAQLDAHRGLRIQVVGSLILIRQSHKPGVGVLPDERSHSFHLSGARVQVPFDHCDYCAAVGSGYLVLGSEVDISRVAGNVPRLPYAKRVKPAKLREAPEAAAISLQGMLAWKDLTTFRTTKLYDSRTALIEHSVWSLAGFELDDWLQVERLADATIITRGEQANAWKQLRYTQVGQARLRMNVGPHIFNMAGLKHLRVLAFDKKLVLVHPESKLARACPLDLVMPHGNLPMTNLLRAHLAGQPAKLPAVVKPASPPAQIVEPRASYNLHADGRRLQLQGVWLRDSGLEAGSRYSVRPTRAGGLRVLPAADGEYAVTGYGETPKLYVPRKHLTAIRGKSVDVVCTPEGLVLHPRQVPSTTYGSRARRA